LNFLFYASGLGQTNILKEDIMARLRNGIALLLLFISSAVFVRGQTSNGTILGAVSDSSAAAIANASVTVTNTATMLANHVVTGNDGNYNVPQLIPGPYRVTVEVPGFKQFVADNLILMVDQKLRVDAVLEPGAVATHIDVTAIAQLVETDSSSVGKVVENKQIIDIPLVNRNFLQLAWLSPGVMTDNTEAGGGGGTSMSMQVGLTQGQIWTTPLSGGALWVGGQRSTSNQYLIDGINNNDPGFQTPTINPSIDAIEEFKLMSKDYSADFGGSGAQVNISTKSGTNVFHGTAYEFARNDAMDTRGFFDVCTMGVCKQKLRYNQFGAAIGGPIKKDKWFFFGNYESIRDLTYTAGLGEFPTAAELSGNFAGDAPIYDPTTGAPFPNNVILPGRFDKKAQQLLAEGLFPATNAAGGVGYNTATLLAGSNPVDMGVMRVDGRITAKDTLFARASVQNSNITAPGLAPLSGTYRTQDGRNVALGWTRVFSGNLVNELRLGYNRPVSILGQEGAGTTNDAGIFTGTSQVPITWGAPALYLTNYTGAGGYMDGPLSYRTNSYEISDAVTWTRNKHTLKAGISLRHFLYTEYNTYNFRGSLTFSGMYTAGAENTTGNAAADLLLGLPFDAAVNSGVMGVNYHSMWYDPYVQDDWKVSRKLTVNMGLRYEYRTPMVEEGNNISTADLYGYPGGRAITPNQAAVTQYNSPLLAYTNQRGLIYPDHRGFAPRVGFAYRPFDNNRTVLRGGYGVFFDNFQFNEYSFSYMGPPWAKDVSVTGTLAQPIDMDTLFPVASSPLVPGTGPSSPGLMGMLALNPHDRMPYIQEWNFDIQRELASGWLLDLGYQGSKGTKLPWRTVPSQGQIQPNGSIVFPDYNFSYIMMEDFRSKSNYDALTARLEKRFSNGFYLIANYTYEKVMGMGSGEADINYPQNEWDLNSEYGPAEFSVTNRAIISGIYELPFGHGKAIGGNLTGAASKLASGWQLNGVYVIQSGMPYNLTCADNSGTVGVFDVTRCNIVGNIHATDPVDPTRAFNRSAFAQPASGFGNEGIGDLYGKGLNNADISIFKNTSMSERFNMQFRAEFFNAFNHTQVGPFPGTSYGGATTGEYTTLNHGPRVIQLALKLIF
jgi:hypothetical protein